MRECRFGTLRSHCARVKLPRNKLQAVVQKRQGNASSLPLVLAQGSAPDAGELGEVGLTHLTPCEPDQLALVSWKVCCHIAIMALTMP